MERVATGHEQGVAGRVAQGGADRGAGTAERDAVAGAEDLLGVWRDDLMAAEARVPTSALGRMWRAGRAAMGIGGLLSRGRRGEELDLEVIAQQAARLGAMKGIAMKLGQMLSYVDQSVPAAVRARMAVLQTAAPATPAAVVRATLTRAWGEGLAGVDVTWEPIAVASIGQVHRARLADGTEVAVKVRHPGIEDAMRADFRSAALGRTVGAMMGAATVGEVIDEARDAFLEECDFRIEAERQRRFGAIFEGDPELCVPGVIDALSHEDVLVTRWCPGRSFDAFLDGDSTGRMGPSQAERDRVGAALFRFWVGTLYREGLFHADPHPGNFAIGDDGRVIVYDYGCVRRFDRATLEGYFRLADAAREDDLAAMVSAVEAMGGRAPRGEAERERLRELVRGFFGPLVTPGVRRIALDEGQRAASLMADKKAVMRLALPGKLLFLFRLRFGLYAVLARLGAEADWSRMEREAQAQPKWKAERRSPK